MKRITPDEPPGSRPSQRPRRLVSDWPEFTDLAQAVSAVVTALFTGVLTWFGLRQIRIAGDALRETAASVRIAERGLVLAQRPWIQVGVDIAGPLKVDGGGMLVKVYLTMMNVGQTPATHVAWDIRAVLRTRATYDAVVQQGRLAEDIRSQLDGRPGNLIFAKTGIRRTIAFGLSPDEVWAALAEYEPHPHTLVQMYVMGSVSYRFPFDGRLHQTGFIYDIMVKDDTSPLPSMLIDVAGGDIPAERLVLNIANDGSPYVD